MRVGRTDHKFDVGSVPAAQDWTLKLNCLIELASKLTQVSHTVAHELASNPDLSLTQFGAAAGADTTSVSYVRLLSTCCGA